ncbi:hypothetical protein CHGG_03672 [Chaetomium globosum CBS 148.51]|jgi:hypothetical protein|uniref:Transcription factor hoxa13 n=1 Tax=Chaetomium globosum (strain ATCC 6205 / CBS 148.51 / DSM 1962 / NBRC 6347 / NRRL 1970) TaxID=306901 RepID=Q2H7Y2_CHAGB|nr:uncharacterized protein CHGG_03672 [Chaetomium globosum CBS 148.51]EAQ91737.1 hypothetical protein CHGG_03672 [Chaetomium globosum CBS 148.51]
MDNANGTLKAKASRAANGINGAIKSPINGHAIGPKTKEKLRGPGMLARTFSIAARLLTWYSILSILFRCPATLEACDDTSPRICKPYFQLKHALVPRVEPYYDTYAAPYVELVRPYYNTVDQTVITPTWSYAKQYGGPRVQQIQALGTAQWKKSVQPQIEKYQGLARAQYNEKLGPHIDRVSDAFGPYYDIARTNTLQTYHELLVPTYLYLQPHLHEGYRAASAFTGDTVVPVFVWTWNKTYAFLDGTVGPQIRAVYVENVEPQLVKIGKRLGRYSTTGKKSVPKPPTDSSTSASTKTTSSFTKPAVSVTTAPTPTASVSAANTEKGYPSPDSARPRSTMEPIPPPEVDENLENEDPSRRETREIVAADLKDWQERYAKAADEAAAEIDDRVQEIANRMIQRNARTTGKSHLEQLQTSAISELVNLRRAIQGIVGTVNKGGATPEEAQEQIVKVVRRAGMAVKEKGQAVRTWRERYEIEMQRSVTQAAETHFAILENIRDLALQKIGMKWAWTDGITYKDWAKYHLLKGRFDDWKSDLQNHVISHPSLEAAQIEAANIEDEAMGVASTTAKELARLKQVANWKLAAGDDTPEFDSTLMEQAAEAAAQAATNVAGDAEASVVEQAEEDSGHTPEATQAMMEPQETEQKDEEGTSTALGTSNPSSEPAVEASVVLEDSEASPTDPARAEEAPEPEVEAEAEPVAEAPEEPSSVVEPTSEPTPGVVDQPEIASSMVFETPVVVGNFTEQVDEGKAAFAELPVEDSAEDSAEPDREDIQSDETGLPVSDTATVKPALFGAAAQVVPNRKPILDDDDEDTLDDVSAAMDSMREDLKSAYTSAMSRANDQYSQALSIVSVQIRGTPKPAHEKLLASVTAAYSNAMASASTRLDDAIKAASNQLYGTTTTNAGALPTMLRAPQIPGVDWAQVVAIASEQLQQGRAWAQEEYESAKTAIGLTTTASSPPSTPEKISRLLDNARHNYYAGVGLAHERYSEFLNAASSALSSATAAPTPTDLAGSASSAASVVGESAASAASAVSDGASSALSAAAEAGYDTAAAAGDKVAESWDVVVSKISIQVYGAPAPTGWYPSALSAAGEGGAAVTSAVDAYASAGSNEIAKQYSAVSSIMSEVLVGKEPSFSESVISRLSAAYATGLSSASSVADAAQATAASAANQAGEAVRSVGDEVASAASDATDTVKDTAARIKDEL